MRYLKGTATAVLIVLCCAPAAMAGPTVTVRVEGDDATLLPATRVTLGDGAQQDAATGCGDNTAAAAIERATNGNWDRQQFTSTILGETHSYADSDYWEEWIDFGYGGGICTDVLTEGQTLLMSVNRWPMGKAAPDSGPLRLDQVPARARKDQAFTVKATVFGSDGSKGSSIPAPAAGVRITSGGQTLATTAADGTATLTLAQTGTTALEAEDDHTRSAPAEVCVHDGDEGSCGTVDRPPCITAGNDGLCGTKDMRDPVVTLGGALKQGAVFTNAGAPREVTGRVAPDASGLRAVKLSLVRHDGAGHCVYLSGKREEWRRIRCGRTAWFTIGKDAAFSYLLPVKLGDGRYRLDVRAVDGAGNTDAERAPGRNRVVFRVR
jgi:hypothetical protein